VKHATVVHMLAAAAAERPDGEALVCGERRLDYARYAGAVAAFASELEALGARGGRVATLIPNSIEACVAAFATLAAGAQHVPLNPLYTAHELGAILADAVPAVLVADARLPVPAGVANVIRVGPGARRLDPLGAPAALPLPDPDGLALLQYTGGTTGKAKGVNLTHRAIATNVWQREGLLPTAMDGERILCVMPLFHSYAMAMGLFLAVNCRGALVILERYRPEDVLVAVARERVSIFPGSPTLFTGLLGHPEFPGTDWSSVHTCYSGSAALPEETLRRWREAVGAPVYEGYGQTEAGPVLTFNPAHGVTKLGSVGIPVADTQIQIVDVATGRHVLPVGERGEIRARGPQLMQGYRNRPAETAEALRDGWLYTGDIGYVDADGFLFLVDRKKDMIIVGGYNVYPREIDEVLFNHPKIREAATVGRHDSRLGEVVVAFVVVQASQKLSEEEFFAYCRENLVKYKRPVEVHFIETLPRTGTNKINRIALRDRLRAAL
jgi:long-chain acyl-CoA synthetase